MLCACGSQKLEGGVLFDPNSGAGSVAPPSSPKALATTARPWGLAVDDTNVYVASQGTGPLVSVPIIGGAPVTLAPVSNFTVAVDETSVYWSDGTLILACDKQNCGGTISTLGVTPAGGLANGIAIDATSVYWTTTTGGSVMKVDKKGGPSTVLSSSTYYPYLIAADGANVYWTDTAGDGSGIVMAMPSAGGAPVLLATAGATSTGAIAVDGQNVYFATGDGKMMQVPKSGGAAITLSADLGNSPEGLATDGKNVYGAITGRGTIVRVPVGGGAVKVLASGQNGPTGIAVDGNSVYWSALDGGQVMRMAK